MSGLVTLTSFSASELYTWTQPSVAKPSIIDVKTLKKKISPKNMNSKMTIFLDSVTLNIIYYPKLHLPTDPTPLSI